MRLINLQTLELREFVDSERPPYVILSHTWGGEEVTLQHLQQLPHGKATDLPCFLGDKAGYRKIRAFARKGRGNGFEWGWVDTCCIDKTSSAELSESINSMFRWYAEADSCYAYLSDVFDQESEGIRGFSLKQQFAASRWFTRGWTLQELLAPSSVTFYLRDWTVYGTKSSLSKEISIITKIPEKAIYMQQMSNFAVGARISWVSRRQTTRPEDLSYCLLGILDVNMPLLYGEGTRAFMRLQEEVLKKGTDPTIFAWPSNSVPTNLGDATWISLLAPSPENFADSGNYCKLAYSDRYGPWTMTNRGLRIEGLPILDDPDASTLLESAGISASYDKAYVVAVIGCGTIQTTGSDPLEDIGIALYKHPYEEGIYYRLRTPESLLLMPSGPNSPLLKRMLPGNRTPTPKLDCIIQLDVFGFEQDRTPRKLKTGLPNWIVRGLPERGYGFNDFKIHSQIETQKDGTVPSVASAASLETIEFSNKITGEMFFVMLGESYNNIPWVCLCSKKDDIGITVSFYGPADQFVHMLQSGEVAVASLVPGIRNKERVVFLDVCIRDEA